MKYIATLIFAILFSGAAIAQLGVNATYRTNDAPDWTYSGAIRPAQDLLPETAIAIGLDYWLAMKAYRIDFVPELNFSRMSNTLDMGIPLETIEANLTSNWLSLFLNTNIYFLDLEGDCDCPTFSKSGGAVQKGIFLQVSPGATWMMNQAAFKGESKSFDDITFSLGAALGLDIGLSDIVTLTPMIGFRYYFPAQWEGLAAFLSGPDIINIDGLKSEESSIRQLYAGLRLGIRLDQR